MIQLKRSFEYLRKLDWTRDVYAHEEFLSLVHSHIPVGPTVGSDVLPFALECMTRC
jgi:hypothetical protein